MKKIVILFLSVVLIMGLAYRAQAALVLGADFDGDGVPEPAPVTATDISWIFDVRPDHVRNIANVGLYVSNVPDPGLISMGLDLEYDSAFFKVLSAEYDRGNWQFGTDPDFTSTPGLVDNMRGGRISGGLSGDLIKLGTVEFQCIQKDLTAGKEFWIFDSDRGGTYADFVLEDGTELDGDIVDGFLVARCPNVPIPTTFLLLGCGLIGLAGLKRKTS